MSLSGSMSGAVCAVVVAYCPDDMFETRLHSILPQVDQLLVVDNSPPALGLLAGMLASSPQRWDCIRNAANKGIALALNQGLQYAQSQGCQWMLSLDQDSECLDDMVDTLLAAQAAAGVTTAIVGSNYFDPVNQRCKVAANGPSTWLEQKTVITSGCLVNVEVALRIGGFRADYFIDQVDHEFCLRARAHCHRVVISRKPTMRHSVGLSGGPRLPMLGVLPNHPPVRKYYIARNTLVTVAQYWRSEPVWCLKRLLKLLLGGLEMVTLESQRRHKAAAFVQGIADALRGRMGPWRPARQRLP